MAQLSGADARPYAVRSAQRGLWTGVDQASVMGMELMAGILTLGGLGWLADRWLGTGPWLLMLGALVGNAAGLYLIWVRRARMNAEEEARRAADDRGAGP